MPKRTKTRLLLAAAGLAAWTVTQFTGWRRQRLAALRRRSRLADTARGPVEYALHGRGPTLLLCHGAPGGHDQLHMLDDLVAAGYRVLAPSRPGYLRTPLSTGATPEAQADALAALLDTLDIDQVAVVGASAGGPTALQFALRHPQRAWALLLLSAVTRPYHPNADTAATPLGRLFLANPTPAPETPRRNTDYGIRITEYAADFAAWLLDRLAARQPALAARALLAAESSLPPDQLHTAVSDILADPAQTVALQQLLRTTVPLSPRQAGLANDLTQLAALPRYPLERIATPTLVIHGRFDADVPYEHATFAANALPNAERITQPHSGHLIWLGREWPASRQRLLAFLQAHAPAPPAVPPPTTARQLRAALEATRLAYHALLAEIPPTAWERPTANPAWNVRQVLTHMLIAPENLPLDVRFIRAGRTLKPPMWLFNSLNRLYTRRRARGQTAASLAQQYDAAHARVVALLDTIGADEWALAGDYPDVNANLAAGEHTLEDMFRYLTRHFAEHAAEIRQAVAQGAQA